MKFLEKDLEEIVFNSENKNLLKRGLEIYGNKLRQKKVGNYGITDIISYYKEYDYFDDYVFNPEKKAFDCNLRIIPSLVIDVFELKQEKIGVSAFLQCCNYVKGIKDYLEKRDFNNYRINIILIGKTIDVSGSICYLPDIFDNVTFYNYDYNIDGISFKKKQRYFLTDNGFNL